MNSLRTTPEDMVYILYLMIAYFASLVNNESHPSKQRVVEELFVVEQQQEKLELVGDFHCPNPYEILVSTNSGLKINERVGILASEVSIPIKAPDKVVIENFITREEVALDDL